MKPRVFLLLLYVCLITVPYSVLSQNITNEEVRYTISDIHRLTTKGSYGHPKWSPNGKYIAFVNRDIHGMSIYNISTEEIKHFSNCQPYGDIDSWYFWLSDSETILYHEREYTRPVFKSHISSLNAKNGYQKKLFETENEHILHFQKSSDDTVTFFVEEKNKLYSLDKDGIQHKEDGFVLITDFQNSQINIVNESNEMSKTITDGNGRYISPKQSPSGEFVLYESMVGDYIFCYDIKQDKTVMIGQGSYTNWSPGSREIVYCKVADDGHRLISSDIYISSTDGEFSQALTNSKDIMEIEPDVSPDGTQIVFTDYTTKSIFLANMKND